MKAGAKLLFQLSNLYSRRNALHLQNGDVKQSSYSTSVYLFIQSLTTRLPSLENIIIWRKPHQMFNHTETEKMKTFTRRIGAGDE